MSFSSPDPSVVYFHTDFVDDVEKEETGNENDYNPEWFGVGPGEVSDRSVVVAIGCHGGACTAADILSLLEDMENGKREGEC
jgi:hypothetical protein